MKKILFLGYSSKQTKIIDISVIVPIEQLNFNYKSRINNKNHGYNNLEKIMNSRNRLIENSNKNKIPIFKNIYFALNYIINIWNKTKK